ncbi:MAG: T9SS type A sorting domain-containing protein [Bacteroidales bacterium]|nr:T9SS type A sorting domain-containing protein [Bacteroidales bacterium]
MKKIAFLMMLLVASSMSFAQRGPVNFETDGQGADWTWNVFENSTNPALEIITNPDQSGINTSLKVAKYTALQAGQPYAGVESAHGASNLGPFVLDATNSTIKIMVWKSVISDVGIKLVAPTGWAQAEKKVANTLVNQWEELTFDFSDYVNPPSSEGQLDQVVIFPDFNLSGRTQDNIIYFDNITFSAASTPPGVPAVAAPIPGRSAANVISIFSDTYTNVAGTNLNPFWGQGTVVTQVSVAGNNTLKLAGLDYQGIELGSNLDVTSMEYLHIDFWSASSTALNLFLISPGPVEKDVPLTVPTSGWTSIDIPLSSFSPVDLASLFQFKFTGNGDIYIDNIYFWKAPLTGPFAPVNFEADGYGADWTWNVFENATNPALEIITNPDQSGLNVSSKVAKFTALQAGQPYAGVESAHGATNLGPFVLDATNSTIKILVWKSVISDVGIKLVAPTGWAQAEKKVANTLVNQWEELVFDFSDYVNPPVEEGQLDQIVIFPDFNLSGRTQDNIVYFDNITFWPTATTPTGPTVAAPTPAHDAANVISLFSNAYTNVTVDTWRTAWSAATLEEVTIEGNATKKYTLLDFVGIETQASQLNISEMTYLHLDVWSPNFTFFGVKLVDFGADGVFGGGNDTEHQVNFISPSQSQWVSLDIPLSDFTNLTGREHIAQYILVGQPTGTTTVYVDNFYFYSGWPTGVREETDPSAQVVIYPNPVRAGEQVSLSNDARQVTLYDFGGRRVLSQNTSVINTAGLSKGIYIVRINTWDGGVQIQKLIVN